jgi:hypothetical protein
MHRNRMTAAFTFGDCEEICPSFHFHRRPLLIRDSWSGPPLLTLLSIVDNLTCRRLAQEVEMPQVQRQLRRISFKADILREGL